jgi:predicted kinase
MNKVAPSQPILVLLYGYPGSGKSHFARQLQDSLQAAHISSDRIRSELFEQPRYNKRENEVVSQIAEYMTEEFLTGGMSVIYDTNAMRVSERRELYNIAYKTKAKTLLIWLQIDVESAFTRISKRDRRRTEDRDATPYDRSGFDDYIKNMQNPHNEEYVVISGKHTFNTQLSALVTKLYELGLIDSNSTSSRVVKPGMINLVPKQKPKDAPKPRRNIAIR